MECGAEECGASFQAVRIVPTLNTPKLLIDFITYTDVVTKKWTQKAMYISELSWILDDQTKRHRREPPETGENCKGLNRVTMQYARAAALQIQ